jgi:hypothetical protein
MIVGAAEAVDDERREHGGTLAARPSAAADEPLSLLWPPGRRPARRVAVRLSPETMADLDLDPVIVALTGGEGRRAVFVQAVLAALCDDPEVIAYRAAALTDLTEDEAR